MGARMQAWRRSRTLALVMVTCAVFLDAVLLTVLVPMLPHLLSTSAASDAVVAPTSTATNLAWNSQFKNSIMEFLPTNRTSDADRGNTTADDGISSLTMRIGFLLASKPIFEMVACLFIGVIVDRTGYSIPMFLGFFVTLASTLTFAFAETYGVLFIARSFQGIGSAAIVTPGYGLLADVFPDEVGRGRAMSTFYAGSVVGILVGPVFGGIMYHIYGKTTTYLVLTAALLVDGCLRGFIANPEKVKKEKDSTFKDLLMDRYILLVMGAIFFTTFCFTTLEPILPSWMMVKMHATPVEQGLAFAPMTLTLTLTVNSVSRLSLWMGRAWMAMVGLILTGIFLILLPLANNLVQLMIPSAILGVSLGMVECSMIPNLGYLVDLRHTSSYGTVYGILQSTYSFSSVLGGVVGGTLASIIGFEWTLYCVAAVIILYAPWLYFLRDPPSKEEELALKKNELHCGYDNELL